ncbi:uncharacterized protein LOC116720627 [Xiphophorus hellerii]|uniref:uncharacterized protein LOC116720627 n=1 Tax=Xiphophorus hellerii TaxID=8084 RepID=UPI0013B437D2|nr:uncharacterized protein LOC116720627 [Xiphophorus hellerii]
MEEVEMEVGEADVEVEKEEEVGEAEQEDLDQDVLLVKEVQIFHQSACDLPLQQYCISHGGNLASIHCQEEYAFIRNFIFHVAGNSRRTWVGGYDGIEEGIWQWSDGSRNDFSMWGPRGPNNCDTENCMEINVNGVEIKLLCIWLHTQNSLIKFTTLHFFNYVDLCYQEKRWLWSDGSSFEFAHWHNNQPDNSGGNQHCLDRNYGGKQIFT